MGNIISGIFSVGMLFGGIRGMVPAFVAAFRSARGAGYMFAVQSVAVSH